MIVLTVAGKADSRAVVYPALYMLSNFGKVIVATDDAAYRRLYHGYSDSGEVSGVGIYVHPTINAEILTEEVNRWAPDFLVCVTNGYVPAFTTHLLVLTGYDRSFIAGNAFTKEESERGVDVSIAEDDKVKAPEGLPIENIRELIVSRTPVKSKSVLSVCLKDGLFMYTAKCEEYKQLFPHDSRDFVTLLMKLFSPFIIPDATQVPKMFGFKK